MQNRPASFAGVATATALLAPLALALLAGALGSARPARALPTFSRRYNVPCQTCHTVAPHLNRFGLAFQANYFRWPSDDGSAPPRPPGLLSSIPLSGMATFSRVENRSQHVTSDTDFRSLELFLADGFTIDRKPGGFFLDTTAIVRDSRGGDLENAWVAVPVAGDRGQLALVAGQFTPMLYQYDPINRLTASQPAGLATAAGGVGFADPVPGVRLDWFNNRGKSSADGDYVSLGVPFRGHLTLNDESRLGDGNGLFLHAFRRRGGSSLGAFGYTKGSSRLGGVLGTHQAREDLYLLGAATVGHDRFGNPRALSLGADYIPLPYLGLTARMESTAGSGFGSDTYPVAAITLTVPGRSFLRLTGETVQQKGNRTFSLYGYVQF